MLELSDRALTTNTIPNAIASSLEMKLNLNALLETHGDREPLRASPLKASGSVYRRYPEKRMYQAVIYLKPSSSALVYQQSFRIPGTSHQFQVLRLWEQAEEVFWQCQG